MQKLKSTLSKCTTLLIVIICLVSFSCSKESKLAGHIPKDATVVLAMDVKSMGMKSLDFKELLSVDNMKKLFEAMDDTAAIDYKNSGIDILNKAYFFGKGIEGGKGYGAAIVALSDSKKFETFVKKLKKNAIVSEDGGYHIADLSDSVMLGWNDTETIVIFSDENPKETLLSLANLKSDESLIGSNDTFKDLEKGKSDISVWVNLEGAQKMVPQYNAMAGGSSINMKDSYITATCNFEDGQIVVDSKYMGNDELMKQINFTKESLSGDIIKTLPGKDLMGVAGLALDMNKLYAYLESQKLLQSYDPLATQFAGMSLKDIFSMLSGDLAVSVNGVEMKEVDSFDPYTGEPVKTKQPDVDYCALIGIADKAKAKQFLDHFAEAGMIVKNDDYYTLDNKLFIVEKDNMLVLVGKDATRLSINGNSTEKLSADLSSMLTANTTTIYVNMNNISNSPLYSGDDEIVGTHIRNSEVEDITLTSTGVKGNISEGKFVVRFKDKSVNSLVTLGRISRKYAEMFKEPVVAATVDPVNASDDMVAN